MSTYVKRYNPDRSPEWNYGGRKWKLSRSKIEFFIECPRCFYLDNKLGTKRPSMPSFTLNNAVDTLLKKEFDQHRTTQTVHPLLLKHNLNLLPFKHIDLEEWRDTFAGITVLHEPTGMYVSGAVDDIWINEQGELIVVDYKATSKEGSITTLSDSAWEEQYKRQMGVYQWLLKQKGFQVDSIGYFVYANALTSSDMFGDRLFFETTLIQCQGETDWIDNVLISIFNILESDTYPDSGAECEFCSYRTACGKKLQAMYEKRQN